MIYLFGLLTWACIDMYHLLLTRPLRVKLFLSYKSSGASAHVHLNGYVYESYENEVLLLSLVLAFTIFLSEHIDYLIRVRFQASPRARELLLLPGSVKLPPESKLSVVDVIIAVCQLSINVMEQ